MNEYSSLRLCNCVRVSKQFYIGPSGIVYMYESVCAGIFKCVDHVAIHKVAQYLPKK